jgi:hypothetical protein
MCLVALTVGGARCYSVRPSREGRCGRPAIVVKSPIRHIP